MKEVGQEGKEEERGVGGGPEGKEKKTRKEDRGKEGSLASTDLDGY